MNKNTLLKEYVACSPMSPTASHCGRLRDPGIALLQILFPISISKTNPKLKLLPLIVGVKNMSTKEYAVPLNIQEALEERVKKFNKKKLADAPCKYCIDARGKFIYLRYLYPNNTLENVARLTYSGNLEEMEFAIFKHSTQKYDAKDWLFPGDEFVDGTIEGAMKAGLVAYPPQEPLLEEDQDLFQALVNFFATKFS